MASGFSFGTALTIGVGIVLGVLIAGLASKLV
jgi:hypothetical protein